MNEIYKDFANIYSTSKNYIKYSERIALLFPQFLSSHNMKINSILDISCGEGTFCREVSKMGYDIAGLDLSKNMLDIAKNKTIEEGLKIDYFNMDMREINIEKKFDMVTCWYDSLNYILDINDIEKVFSCVHKILNDGGYFIFDMNTRYALSFIWTTYHNMRIEQNESDLFEAHQVLYDYENDIATLIITAFINNGNDIWKKIYEEHRERAYTISQIRNCFSKNGFYENHIYDNFEKMTTPNEKSTRIYFVLRKKIASN